MTAPDRPAPDSRSTQAAGQAAYEAFYAGTECGAPVPWAQLTDWDEHWVAAAQAAIDRYREDITPLAAPPETEAIAAAAPAPAGEGALRAALEATLKDWRDDAVYRPTDTRDEMSEHSAVTACANTLAGILADHPQQPQAAPASADEYRKHLDEVFAPAHAEIERLRAQLADGGDVVHLSPPDGAQRTPCCDETPFDLPRADRITNDPSLATCGGPEPQAAPEPDATTLRNLLDEDTRLRWETGLDRQHTSQLRARAGLEAL